MALTFLQIATRVSQIALTFPQIVVTIPQIGTVGLFDNVRAISGTIVAI